MEPRQGRATWAPLPLGGWPPGGPSWFSESSCWSMSVMSTSLWSSCVTCGDKSRGELGGRAARTCRRLLVPEGRSVPCVLGLGQACGRGCHDP